MDTNVPYHNFPAQTTPRKEQVAWFLTEECYRQNRGGGVSSNFSSIPINSAGHIHSDYWNTAVFRFFQSRRHRS